MRVSILLVAVLMAACAELSKMKVGPDGYYHFPLQPVSVWAPDECLLDMFVHTEDYVVDFVTGRGYWDEGGVYALAVYEIPPEITDKESFWKSTESALKAYLVKDRARIAPGLQVIEMTPTEIRGRAAYQGISVDTAKAVFVATAQLHESRVTMASLLYPLKGQSDPKAQVPWRCYNQFVESVRERP